MIRRLALPVLLLAALTLPACSSTPAAPADQVVDRLVQAVVDAQPGTVLTPENDPNRLLGRPGQYTSAASLVDVRVPGEVRQDAQPGSVDTGAKVEVFADESGAQDRDEYIGRVTQGSPFGVEYRYRSGAALLRVTGALPPGAAEQYRVAFEQATSQ